VGETSMVTQEYLDEGARLVQELDSDEFPVTASFWAYDPSADLPRLIIAVPAERIESFRAGYEKIRDVITRNDISVPLSRISLMLDDDPAIANIKALAEADYRDIIQAAVGTAEIGGHTYDDVHVYNSDALRYERELFAALQRLQPSSAVLRRDLRVDERSSFDFFFDNGNKIVAIEAKRFSRPVDVRDILQEDMLLRHAYVNFRRPATLIIVSRSGFTPEAMEAVKDTPEAGGIRLVQWVDANDNDKLRRALTDLLNWLSKDSIIC
jgi:hypothetical protein